MEINGASGGAATYALKKALAAPEAVMDVVQEAGAKAGKTLAVQSPESTSQSGRAVAAGKGLIIDVVA